MASLSLTSFTSLTISVLLHLHLMHGAMESNKTTPLFPALFTFGDSIVDTGNNNKILTPIRCDFPPYGQDFINHKATGRFCNGKIPSDLLATYFGLKQVLPAYSTAGKHDLLTGVSFASGGTGYDNLTAQVALVIPMSKQLEMLKEYHTKLISMVGDKKASSIISEGLFLVCAGSNDVVDYFRYPFRKTYNVPAYADFLMHAVSNFTRDLLNLGAKRIGVLGIPPIGCVPSQRNITTRDCTPELNQLARLFNSKLTRALQRLASSYEGRKIVYMDVYTPLLDIIQHPNKYGFEESTKGCCGALEVAILCNSFSDTCTNTSSYVFWDSFHPTERTYGLIVDEVVTKYVRYLI